MNTKLIESVRGIMSHLNLENVSNLTADLESLKSNNTIILEAISNLKQYDSFTMKSNIVAKLIADLEDDSNIKQVLQLK
jgi:hypothetical protein